MSLYDDYKTLNEIRVDCCGLCGHHRKYPAGRTIGQVTFPNCDCECHRNIMWVMG